MTRLKISSNGKKRQEQKREGNREGGRKITVNKIPKIMIKQSRLLLGNKNMLLQIATDKSTMKR